MTGTHFEPPFQHPRATKRGEATPYASNAQDATFSPREHTATQGDANLPTAARANDPDGCPHASALETQGRAAGDGAKTSQRARCAVAVHARTAGCRSVNTRQGSAAPAGPPCGASSAQQRRRAHPGAAPRHQATPNAPGCDKLHRTPRSPLTVLTAPCIVKKGFAALRSCRNAKNSCVLQFFFGQPSRAGCVSFDATQFATTS